MFNATYATRILNEFIHAILLIVDAVLTDVGSNQGPTFRAPRGVSHGDGSMEGGTWDHVGRTMTQLSNGPGTGCCVWAWLAGSDDGDIP